MRRDSVMPMCWIVLAASTDKRQWTDTSLSRDVSYKQASCLLGDGIYAPQILPDYYPLEAPATDLGLCMSTTCLLCGEMRHGLMSRGVEASSRCTLAKS